MSEYERSAMLLCVAKTMADIDAAVIRAGKPTLDQDGRIALRKIFDAGWKCHDAWIRHLSADMARQVAGWTHREN